MKTAPHKPIHRHRPLQYLLSLVIAGACLWLALRDVDLRAFGEVLAGASPLLILAAGILSVAVSAIHCTKIRVLMSGVHRLRYRTVFSAELVAILVDTIFPLRLQELTKSYVIGKGEGLRPSKIMGVLVVEKAVEVPLLLALMFSLGLSHDLPSWAQSTIWVGLAGTGLVVLMLLLAVTRPGVIRRPIRWLGEKRMPGARAAGGVLEQMLEGMRLGATRPSALVLIVLITVVEWSVLGASLWLAAAALGVHLGGWETLGLLVTNFVAFAMPAKTSGAVGIYELAGKTLMMMLFGMAAEQALALVMMAHAVMLVFGTLGGLAGLVMAQVSMAEMRDRLRQAAREDSGR